MVWLQRGLFGLDFKRQTNIVGIAHLVRKLNSFADIAVG